MNTTAAPGNIPNHLAWAIISTILSVCTCCGFLGLFSGIVAIIFSAQVNSKLSAGDFAGAQQSSNTAKILCWVTTVFALLGLLYWIFVFSTAGMSGIEEAIKQVIEEAERSR